MSFIQISIHPTKLIKNFEQLFYLRADILLYFGRNQLNNSKITHQNPLKLTNSLHDNGNRRKIIKKKLLVLVLF